MILANSKAVEQILCNNGVEFRRENSASWSERHGPSSSVYFYTSFGKIRISDHDNIICCCDLDLEYHMPLTELERRMLCFIGVEPSEELVKQAKDDVAELRRIDLADAYERDRPRREREQAVQDRICNDMIMLGLTYLTGKTKRRIIARLHSKKGRDALYFNTAEEVADASA